MWIVQVDLTGLVRRGSDDHDALGDLGQQQVGERERSEEVGSECHLEPVDGGTPLGRHHARIVDEDVERSETVGASTNRGQIGDIEFDDLGVGASGLVGDLLGTLLAAIEVAYRQHHLGPDTRQATRGFPSDAVRGTGDDNTLAVHTWQVGHRPAGFHAA